MVLDPQDLDDLLFKARSLFWTRDAPATRTTRLIILWVVSNRWNNIFELSTIFGMMIPWMTHHILDGLKPPNQISIPWWFAQNQGAFRAFHQRSVPGQGVKHGLAASCNRTICLWYIYMIYIYIIYIYNIYIWYIYIRIATFKKMQTYLKPRKMRETSPFRQSEILKSHRSPGFCVTQLAWRHCFSGRPPVVVCQDFPGPHAQGMIAGDCSKLCRNFRALWAVVHP